MNGYETLCPESLLSNIARTFNLFNHLGQEHVPQIRYWFTSPKEEKPENQPSRYNDRTVIGYNGYNKGADVFEVSDSFGGRIMNE